MTKVTREMIAAAHDVTMRHKIVLGHELLTEIYQAMDAKREFVGLTEQEIEKLAVESGKATFLNDDEQTDILWFDGDCVCLARAIEAKLKEKNNG